MGIDGLVFLSVAIGILTIVSRSFVIIQQYEEGLVFRYGRFIRKLPPGVNFVLPLIDVVGVVDMRIRSIDVPRQKVISSDNAVVGLDAIIYYRPIEAEKLILNVAQYEIATIKLSQTALRSIVGDMQFDALNSERNEINGRLNKALAQLGNKWGIEIIRAEIGQIIPQSNSLRNALLWQVRAERLKRATILESEGMRDSLVINAQGARQAIETTAQGRAKAKVNLAQGEAQGIGIVSHEAKKIEGSALSIWEIGTWKALSSSKNSNVVLPYNLNEFMACMKGIEGK
jgi:regulator of protease activity HflC (stomatin/prohibitin superfamily)